MIDRYDLELKSPAAEPAILALPKIDRLPEDYIDFLRSSNGAEGFVGNAYLALYPAEEIEPINRAGDIEERAPGLIAFGSDGGGRAYCFDTLPAETEIVEIHLMDIGFEKPIFCARSFADFLNYLCLRDRVN